MNRFRAWRNCFRKNAGTTVLPPTDNDVVLVAVSASGASGAGDVAGAPSPTPRLGAPAADWGSVCIHSLIRWGASMDETERAAWDIFSRHIRVNDTLDDLALLEVVLPEDPDVLSRLQAICQRESRKALDAGRHLEGRRLDTLAHQLRSRMDPR